MDLNSIKSNEKLIHFRFLYSPIQIIGDDNNDVKSIVLQRNKLETPTSSKVIPSPNDTIKIDCSLILTSIGYKGLPFDGVPFDSKNNVILNNNGKINDMNGMYVTGWIKRGPTGIIGTNITDANETVDSLLNDYNNGLLNGNYNRYNIDNILKDNGVMYVDKYGWNKINKYEMDIGNKSGKPREKLLDISEMLNIAS